MQHTKYILKKDTPNVKAGSVFEPDGKGNYHYWATYKGENEGFAVATYSAEVVENNPDWFKHVEIFGGIKIHEIIPDVSNNETFIHPKRFILSTSGIIPEERFEAVKKAIESALNDAPDQPAKKEEKQWEILAYEFEGRVYKKNSFSEWVTINAPIHRTILHPENKSEIHSVKRLSDGEVFTVDDITDQGRITGFFNDGNTMLIAFENNLRWSEISVVCKVAPAPKLYTEKEVLDREEKAFNAARERTGGFWNDQIKNYSYYNFSSYKNNQPKQ